MTIRYLNGLSLQATLLLRTDEFMRVAPEASDNVVELFLVDGLWITDDGDLVQVEFAYERRPAVPAPTADNCICPKEFAAELIHMLFAGEDEPEAMPIRHNSPEPSYQRVV